MTEKLQTMFKNKNTYYILGVVTLLLLLSLLLLLKPSRANPTGTFADQQVGDYSFTNATLTKEGQSSTYRVKVVNTSNTTKELSLIEIHLKDASNKELEVLYGYIGNSLNSKEIRELTASIDIDLSQATTVEYIIK